VQEVKADTTIKRITSNIPKTTPKTVSAPGSKKATAKVKKQLVGKTCPKCERGSLIKGGTAYGCSAYKNGCKFLLPFKIHEKKISENQLIRLVDKGSTSNLKGFVTDSGKVEGVIKFDENFNLKLEPKAVKSKANADKIACPKCKKGTILKGKTAYGCSQYKSGCDFVFSFQKIKETAKDKPLTKELVLEIISG